MNKVCADAFALFYTKPQALRRSRGVDTVPQLNCHCSHSIMDHHVSRHTGKLHCSYRGCKCRDYQTGGKKHVHA